MRRLKRRLKVLCRRDIAFVFEQSHGVVHIGASTGQETFRYAKIGLEVLWVEPIPEIFDVLQQNIRVFAGQRAVKALVSDSDSEEKRFFVASNNGMSSSFLPPKRHADVWQDIRFDKELRLSTIRLDTLFRVEDIDRTRYDCLVLDTQGTELLVLKGAGSLLAKFRFIIVEAADFEAYEGCCTLETVSRFLLDAGFRERLRECHPVGDGWNYFEVLFERTH